MIAKNISSRKLQTDFDNQMDLFGGEIPGFQLAHVDKYGQIVSDFDSKIRVSVDQEYYERDQNTRRYTPTIEGVT